jgi:transposase-like protein
MGKYRKYSKEFKLQAAKLVTEQGYSYEQQPNNWVPPVGR